MKNNIQNISKLISLIAVVAILFCTVVVPSFAFGGSEDTRIPYVNTANLTGADIRAASLQWWIPSTASSTAYYSYTTLQNQDIYFFLYKSGSNIIVPCAVSDQNFSSSDVKTIRYIQSSNNSSESNYNSTPHGPDPTYGLYYFTSSSISYPGNGQIASGIDIFDTLEDGLEYFSSYVPGNAPSPVNFALNPGYCAFLDISNLTGVEVSLYTTLFGGADWNNHRTDQSIGSVASLPSSFSLPISGTSAISWSGTGSKNILGQYKSFSASYTYTSSGTRYLVIVNPLQASLGAQLTAMASLPSERNNPISVSVTQARSCKIYSMTSSLDVGSGNLDIDSNGDTNSGIPDENGNWSWVNDQTGTPIEPGNLPIGGGNDPIIGQETSINDWLQDIANQIKGFFSGAIGAVTTLVGAGSSFIHTLISLYSWLPAPVYAVLSSALILVITIGVIKVFI